MDKHPEFRNIVIGAGFSGNREGTNGYFIYMCFRAVVWLFIRDNCIHVITVNQWQTQNKLNNEGIGLDRIFICLFIFKSDQKRISPQNVEILSSRRLVKGKEKIIREIFDLSPNIQSYNHEKCMLNYVENVYVDLRSEKVRSFFSTTNNLIIKLAALIGDMKLILRSDWGCPL